MNNRNDISLIERWESEEDPIRVYDDENFDHIEEVNKFNPYHDRLGRFTHSGGASLITFNPGASRAHDNAIERERIKQNYYYGKDRADVEESWHRLNSGYAGFRESERRPVSPYDGDTNYYNAKIRNYEKRMKDAEDMLAFMDKYGTNNPAKDKQLRERKKETSSDYDVLNEIYEQSMPKPKRSNSYESRYREEEQEVLRRVNDMASAYKPKRKKREKPDFTQVSLFD